MSTLLRRIPFGPVWGASGVQGFFGEGYPHHKLLHATCPGFCFEGMTFVAKTTTFYPRLNPAKKEGNMPMKKDGITPAEFIPKCIVVKPSGTVLNAVGLSGPGLPALLDMNSWQQRYDEAFMISLMSVGSTDERLKQLRLSVDELKRRRIQLSVATGCQINWSCPNVGVARGYEELEDEILMGTDIAAELCMPIIHKFNALIPPKVVIRIAEHPECDGICISNTIPWGQLPERINWKKLFGTDTSPLAEFGGGGLSGPSLLPITCDWVREIRSLGFKKHINAGGGISRWQDVDKLKVAGANSVFVGSVAITRPWRVQSIVRRAYEIL